MLHQHQRPRKFWDNGSGFREAEGTPRTQNSQPRTEYVEVTLEDIALANQLAPEVLGRSLDELPPQTRALLGHIRELMKQKRTGNGVGNRAQVLSSFSRRELRDLIEYLSSLR